VGGLQQANLSNKLTLSSIPSINIEWRKGMREKESDGLCGEMGVRKAGISPFKNKNCYPVVDSTLFFYCLTLGRKESSTIPSSTQY